MSYKTLEHATDAIIEVTADNLKEAFKTAGISVIETILDISKVEEKENKKIIVCLLYTSPSPRDISGSRMPSSA